MGAKRAAELNASGHPCYDIPMGGASVTGSVGFAHGFVEFQRQLEESGIRPDYIFHATGTGGTMAGLIDYVCSGKVPQGSNVVFWHTGGATALFAEQEILGNLY